MDISRVPEHTIENLIKAVIKHVNAVTVTNGEEDRNDILIELIQTIKEYSKDVEDYERKDYLSKRFARRHCIEDYPDSE